MTPSVAALGDTNPSDATVRVSFRAADRYTTNVQGQRVKKVKITA